MNPHSMLKFVLSILRHPSKARARVRELTRIAQAPPMSADLPEYSAVKVEVVRVTTEPALRNALLEIYVNNPSPYSRGPMSLEELEDRLRRGLRFYLVKNGHGEYVGVRAFDPASRMLRNTVTDFRHRGQGYQYSAGLELRRRLAAEGFTELQSVVLKSNTRMLRTMIASGWQLRSDPDNPDLVRGVVRCDQ